MRPAQLALESERDKALIGPRGLKPKGSVEWCWQTLALLKNDYRYLDANWRDVERVRAELVEQRAWEKIPPDQPYGSEDAMLRAELGVTVGDLEKRVIAAQSHERNHTAAEKTTADAAPKVRGERTDIGKFPKLSQGERAKESGISTRQQYKLDTLARDFPALFAQVKTGALSVNKAWIESGKGKPAATVYVNAHAIASLAIKRLTPQQLCELIARLEEHLQEQTE